MTHQTNDPLAALEARRRDAQTDLRNLEAAIVREKRQRLADQERRRIPGVSVAEASDYAVLDAGPHHYYYGYEFGERPHPDDSLDTEAVWGYVHTVDRVEVFRASYEEMGAYRGRPRSSDCLECLLFGIGVELIGGAS